MTNPSTRCFASRYALSAVALSLALGLGCGGNGLGCGGSASLPPDPKPWGFPMDQAIEGGIQARITRPGFDKLSSLVPALAAAVLPTQQSPQCLPVQSGNLTIAGTGAETHFCNGGCKGAVGCPLWTSLRPDLAPPGGINLSMADGANPVVNVDAAFDVHTVVPIEYRLCVFGFCNGWNKVCDLHIDGPSTHIKAAIQLGIDGPTGKLTIALANLGLVNLNMGASNCGFAGDLFNFVLGAVNLVAKTFLGDFIVNIFKPQLSQLVAGFVPDPPGMASRIDLASQLASFAAPPEAALELLAVAGGYVSAAGGGLNLGVIAGANSDKDPRTRASSPDPLNSEPSLCVPRRPTYDLGKAPFKLGTQALRGSFLLDPAPDFAGMPDPVDDGGAVQDVALGLSRTFLDLAGFHLYNSGTLCLQIGRSLLGGTLSLGTLGVLVPSLSTINDDPSAPVALTLRPEQPLVFTLGSGKAGDPLLKIGATDLRIDFYGFLEERYVRLFTMAADLNVGVNLAVTTDKDGNPMVQPMLSGIDSKSVSLRVTNTDLLAEDPKKLAATLLKLVDIAVGQLGGAIAPIPLPSLMGFQLDGLTLRRVQTPQDDFVAVLGNLKKTKGSPYFPGGNPDDALTVDPAERDAARVSTEAEVVDVEAPPAEIIRTAVEEGRQGDGDTPGVTLLLGGRGEDPAGLEWSWRIDGGWWRDWSQVVRPTLFDAAFLVQGRHVVEVKARQRGNPRSEDASAVRLDVVIDSVPPDLRLVVDRKAKRVDLVARDNVSDTKALRYAFRTPTGWTTPGPRDQISFDEAWAATANGSNALEVAAYDEQGNQRITTLSQEEMAGFGGKVASANAAAGCSCRIARGSDASDAGSPVTMTALLGLAALWRRRRRGPRASHGRERALA